MSHIRRKAVHALQQQASNGIKRIVRQQFPSAARPEIQTTTNTLFQQYRHHTTQRLHLSTKQLQNIRAQHQQLKHSHALAQRSISTHTKRNPQATTRINFLSTSFHKSPTPRNIVRPDADKHPLALRPDGLVTPAAHEDLGVVTKSQLFEYRVKNVLDTIVKAVPKGKMIGGTIVLVIVYWYHTWLAKKAALEQLYAQYVCLDEEQALSMQNLFQLSKEDIAHIIQLQYPNMTSNGMFEIDLLCNAIYDEINDCRDDRKLYLETLTSVYRIFRSEGEIEIREEEVDNLKLKLLALQENLAILIPSLKFDPQTHAVLNADDVIKVNSIDDLLMAIKTRKDEMLTQLETLTVKQMQLFGDVSIPLDQKQSQLMLVQSDLANAQQEIQTLDQEATDLKIKFAADQVQLPPEQQMLLQYNEIYRTIATKQEEMENYKNIAIDSYAVLPEKTQHAILQWKESQNNIPVSEEINDYNYFNAELDDYDISPFTPKVLFKHLPSGTAGNKRFVKFTEALVAMSLLAKTAWAPNDPHSHHYIPADVLQFYKLNVETVYKDYIADPMCVGGKYDPNHLPGDDFFEQLSAKFGDATKLSKAREQALHYRNIYQDEPKTFECVYEKSPEDRKHVLGILFERANPECKWEEVPDDVKDKIASRFEHLRKRSIMSKLSLDSNPKEKLDLAWSAMFSPDPLPNTVKAFNEYTRGLGNYDQQMTKIKTNLHLAAQQPLSRTQFEKLLKAMMNSGHFDAHGALISRTNFIWPISYHTTSPKVIAQAYYDYLHKSQDDSITLDEFDKAARYWGRIGRYNLWYYKSDRQGQSEQGKFVDKQLERIYRFAHYLGVRDILPKCESIPDAYHLDLNNRLISTVIKSVTASSMANVAPAISLQDFHGKGAGQTIDIKQAAIGGHAEDALTPKKKEKKRKNKKDKNAAVNPEETPIPVETIVPSVEDAVENIVLEVVHPVEHNESSFQHEVQHNVELVQDTIAFTSHSEDLSPEQPIIIHNVDVDSEKMSL